MNEASAARKNWLFWAALVFCTFYQSYRYPFKINSTLTSPTYSDTPLALQVGKFVLACPFLFFAAVKCLRKPLSLKGWLIALTLLYFLAFSIFKIVSGAGTGYLDPPFWMAFAFIVVWVSDSLRLTDIDRFFRFLLICALASNLVEILLFVFFGRLPALAFEGTFAVRFGGFLDDPNGFAAILFLLMGWAYSKFEGLKRKGILAALFIFLLLTQSWTAIIFFFGVVVIWGISKLPQRPIRVTLIGLTCLLLLAIVALNIPGSVVDAFQAMQESKQGSIEGHVFPWAEIAPQWADWVVHGHSLYDPYESWWQGTAVNFGVPWFCLDALLVGYSLVSIQSSLQRSDIAGKPVYCGMFLFGCYFVFGSINLPFSSVFPINVFFFVFSFLVILKKIEDTHTLTEGGLATSHPSAS